MSSMGGQLAFAGVGAYCAAKFALEGFSEALAEEIAPFGIKVMIVEPGAFRTRFNGSALQRSAAMPAYDATVGPIRAALDASDGTQPGDPAKAASAIMLALDSTETPLRLPLGNDAVDAILGHLDSVRSSVLAWEPLSRQMGVDDDLVAA
jgi:NAD(P)-dependent dehydrogenase (short-subunit alcohol dehydrogenase family)